MLNAILMVRPDRRDEPKPFVFADKDGTNLSMVGQNIQTASPPPIENLPLEPNGKASLKFCSMEQFEQWRDAQRKNGWDVQLTDSGKIQQRYFVDSLHVRLTFGGKEALQAIGYLALTFFAQYFPATARQAGIDPFKEFLKLDFSKMEDQESWTPNLVWWDGRNAEHVVGKNPFNFGHAIVVGISAATNRAYAYISLFMSLNFGIDLGPLEDSCEGMVQIFIDPKAEKAPEDIMVVHSDEFSIEIDPAISEGRNPLIVAVNLSAVQFRNPHFPELVGRVLDEIGLPPEYLELELTESVAMHDPESAISIMGKLHNLGIRLSIDDFGTGYSSLSYLKKFQTYKLKIDQSFVRDISTDHEDRAIVSAIVSMARSLGLQTIAEGVETPGQLQFLTEQGCDEVQGYFYSKPIPAEKFIAYLAGHEDTRSK